MFTAVAANPTSSAAEPVPASQDVVRSESPVDVSVCIVNWNCRDFLRACLESILDQPQGVSVEVVVVDNGSTDGAPDLAKREFPEIRLIRNPNNAGFARANNQGAEIARGRYLFFLNNDTWLPAGTLRQLVDFAEAHPQVGLIGPCLRDADGQLQVSYRRRPTLTALLHRTALLRWTALLRRNYTDYRRVPMNPSVSRRVEVLMGAAMFLPRQVFFQVGGWDERFAFGGEDIDLCTRVGHRYAVVYYPQVAITHYGRVSTRQHIGYTSPNVAIGAVKLLRKSGLSSWQLLIYKLAVTLDSPIQLLEKGAQYLYRRLRRDQAGAERSLLAMRGLMHLMARGLPGIWQA